MPLRSPDDVVLKGTCMPRWVKDWYSQHRTINYSGLVQECLIKVIKDLDPDYYDKHKKLISIPKRKENLPNIPII